MRPHSLVYTLTLLAMSAASQAQPPVPPVTSGSIVQRDVNQEKRIEQGLQSGALNTREAAHLQREEAHVDRLEANALKDGKLSTQEKARITRAQNEVSRDIKSAKQNDVHGNPASASSQRMQADVQRNINQQERIEKGVQSGALTKRETARLEAGQSRVAAKEARAGRDGHVGAAEQARVQHAENTQSRRIHREKHDAQEAAK
jgi:hypothetical protein